MWMKVLGVVSVRSYKVCSLHFTEDAFEGRREALAQAGYKTRQLRRDAVPMHRSIEHAPKNVHGPPQGQDDITVEPLVQAVIQRRRCCAVPGCPNGSGSSVSQSVSFYDFPLQTEQKQTWMKVLGVPSDTCHGVVCSLHFSEDAFESRLEDEVHVGYETRRLRCDAVPMCCAAEHAPEDVCGTWHVQDDKVVIRQRKLCAVPGCPNANGSTASQTASFYCFPAQNERKMVWMKALGVLDNRGRKVCSLHFSEDAFEGRHEARIHAGYKLRWLRRDAVPTLHAAKHAPGDAGGTWQVQDDKTAIKQTQRCAVPGCPNASGKTVLQSASFYKFPAENERKKMWMKVLGVLSDKRRRVCSLHFTEDAFEGRLEAQIQAGYKLRRLRRDAMPVRRTTGRAPGFVCGTQHDSKTLTINGFRLLGCDSRGKHHVATQMAVERKESKGVQTTPCVNQGMQTDSSGDVQPRFPVEHTECQWTQSELFP